MEPLSPSDKLAVVLFCLGAAMALILFLLTKTPLTILPMLLGIAFLMVYPVLHFFPTWVPE